MCLKGKMIIQIRSLMFWSSDPNDFVKVVRIYKLYTRLKFRHVFITLQVIRQHSRSTCTLNRSFGYENGQIWVNSGCRATFEVCSCANLKEVDCDSWDFRFQSCPVPGFVTYVQLKEKRSRSDCILDQSYGSSQASIWVDNGCRGRFYVCHAWSAFVTTRQSPLCYPVQYW